MSLPKEPRQKMINLMYLVLTALLALNVSSEILNAFKTVNTSLTTANGIIDKKNTDVLGSLKKLQDKPETKERAAKWGPLAVQAKQMSDQLIAEIEGLKEDLKKEAGLGKMGKNDKGEDQFKEDDLEAATRLFSEPPPIGHGKGEYLKNKLQGLKDQLLKLDTAIGNELSTSLPIDLSTPNNKNWSETYFHMTPTIAAITILSKFENDVKNSAAQVIELCHKKVGEVEVVYDQFQAIVSQSSEYLMPDQELTISGGVGAFSKAAQPTVSIDGASIPLNADGVAEAKSKVGGPGSYSKKVTISFKTPAGKVETREKEVKYTVGSPSGASVSADAVKVLYIGLDNPLSVNGGSAGAERTKASINNGSLQEKGGGKYIANVQTPGEATINVAVDGKSVGDFKFKVKRVPNPIAMIGNSEGGRMQANAVKAQAGVRAELRDFVFEGVEFNIVSFTLAANGGSFSSLAYNPNQGAYFNAESKRIIEKCGPGTTLIIDEIKAVGPGGDTRKLPAILFNLY